MAVRRTAAGWMIALATMSVAPGCGDSVTSPSTQMDEALRLSVTSATLEPGESLRIQATASVPVTWESSDPQVVAVSPTGVVEARKEGDAEITARASGRIAQAKVKVTRPTTSPTPTEPAPTPTEPAPTPTPSTGTLAFQDGFESGTVAASQGGYGWLGYRAASGEGVSVSRDVARSGGYSMKFTYAGDADLCADGSAEQRFTLGENLPEVWMEYYVYLPSGTDGKGAKFVHRKPVCAAESDPNGTVSNNKFFALWGTSYDVRAGSGGVKVAAEYRRTSKAGEGDSYLYGTWCTDTLLCSDWGHPGGLWDPAFTDALRGRWVQVRIHAKVADSKAAANGMLQMWFDGALRIDMQGLDLAPNAGGDRWFRNGYLMGWANSGFDQTTALYVDDFQIFRSSPGW